MPAAQVDHAEQLVAPEPAYVLAPHVVQALTLFEFEYVPARQLEHVRFRVLEGVLDTNDPAEQVLHEEQLEALVAVE